jgi:hypothetical protein
MVFVIPTQEGSHLIAIMLSAFSLSCPLFALMQKVEQKNGGQHKPLRVSVHPRTATFQYFDYV